MMDDSPKRRCMFVIILGMILILTGMFTCLPCSGLSIILADLFDIPPDFIVGKNIYLIITGAMLVLAGLLVMLKNKTIPKRLSNNYMTTHR